MDLKFISMDILNETKTVSSDTTYKCFSIIQTPKSSYITYTDRQKMNIQLIITHTQLFWDY